MKKHFQAFLILTSLFSSSAFAYPVLSHAEVYNCKVANVRSPKDGFAFTVYRKIDVSSTSKMASYEFLSVADATAVHPSSGNLFLVKNFGPTSWKYQGLTGPSSGDIKVDSQTILQGYVYDSVRPLPKDTELPAKNDVSVSSSFPWRANDNGGLPDASLSWALQFKVNSANGYNVEGRVVDDKAGPNSRVDLVGVCVFNHTLL